MTKKEQIKNLLKENEINFNDVKYIANNPSGMRDFPRGWCYQAPGEKFWRTLGKNADEAIRFIKNTGGKDARL